MKENKMENYALFGGLIFVIFGVIWLLRGNLSDAAIWIAVGTAFWASWQKAEGVRDIPNRKMLIWLGIIVAAVLFVIRVLQDFRVISPAA
jgi:hypothetical protein